MEAIRKSLDSQLKGIERYNPENINILEHYLELQARENGYDLEANLALLKLYQFNPLLFNARSVYMILLKALTNLPHTDIDLCKSLLSLEFLEHDATVTQILYLADLLESCKFKLLWEKVRSKDAKVLVEPIAGFEDSIRKFACHVIGITYQRISEESLIELLGLDKEAAVDAWIAKNGWKTAENGFVLVSNQDESIKTKKITEKIDLESVAGIMASAV